jgi:hypothetical protein
MSRRSENYKKHVVVATSIPVRGGGFTVHVDIEDHANKTHVDNTHFESGQRFTTDEEALKAGLQIGYRKIDAGYVVTDLVTNE